MVQKKRQSGFTLIELLVVIAIIALLVGILLPTLGEAKRLGKKAQCESNMKQFGIGSASYATDFQDRIFSFTWRPTDQLSQWADLNNHGGSYNQAAANQAVDIIRRRADYETFPRLDTWIPHVLYSHLVLNDYLAQRLPEKMVACPEDAVRLCWQANPRQTVLACPYPAIGTPRWPFSSNYELQPAGYSFDMRVRTQGGQQIYTVAQGTEHNQYFVGTLPMGNRKLSDVDYPTQKVQMHDEQQRHFGKDQLFYAYEDSRQPLVFFDGSVSTRRTADSNQGFRPNVPDINNPQLFYYAPDSAYESPTKSGAARDIVTGYYRWTRGGLRGVDFAGGEVNTGNPG